MARRRNPFPRKRTAEEKLVKSQRRYHNRRFIKANYVHVDKWNGAFQHPGDEALGTWLGAFAEPSDVLVAAGPRHLRMVEESGHRVSWHLDQRPATDDVLLGKLPRVPELAGSLSQLKLAKPFDGAFVFERLEKQANLSNYLIALRQAVKVGAPICLVVPNVHHELVDDHVNLFTAGTLAYNLVRCGWDLRDALITFDGRFINVQWNRADLPLPWPRRVDEIRDCVPFRNIFQYCTGEIATVYRVEKLAAREEEW